MDCCTLTFCFEKTEGILDPKDLKNPIKSCFKFKDLDFHSLHVLSDNQFVFLVFRPNNDHRINMAGEPTASSIANFPECVIIFKNSIRLQWNCECGSNSCRSNKWSAMASRQWFYLLRTKADCFWFVKGKQWGEVYVENLTGNFWLYRSCNFGWNLTYDGLKFRSRQNLNNKFKNYFALAQLFTKITSSFFSGASLCVQ